MLNFICALKHEARPIIDHYRLVPDGPGQPFITYCNDGGTISLTVTGVGKHAAAAGTGHAIDRFCTGRGDTWLNIGIAGHNDLATGTPVLAAAITDYASGRTWHPGVILATGLAALPLLTVDQPQDGYPDHAMVDMEAAGFCNSACTAATLDRIHCLKVISDNARSPSQNISKQTVIELIKGNINVIDLLVSQLHCSSGAPAAVI